MIMYGCLIASDPVISISETAIDAGIAAVDTVICPIKKPPGIALPGLMEELQNIPIPAPPPGPEELSRSKKPKYQVPGVMFWVAEKFVRLCHKVLVILLKLVDILTLF